MNILSDDNILVKTYFRHCQLLTRLAFFFVGGANPNSVAIPCVEYVMRGIAIVLQSERRRRVWIVILVVAVESTSAGI